MQNSKRWIGAGIAVVLPVAIAGCGQADTSGGGGDGNTLTLWTHNGGNPAELGVVEQIVNDYNASQDKYKVKVQAFPQASYNDSVVGRGHGEEAAVHPRHRRTDRAQLGVRRVPRRRSTCRRSSWTSTCDSTMGKYEDKLYSIGYYDAALAIFARKSALEDAASGSRPSISRGRRTSSTRRSRRSRPRASTPIAFDLGTGDTGTEWWTYAYSPFLQSFGGDLIDRDTYKTSDGVLNGDAAEAWASWMQSLVANGYTPKKSGTDAFADFVNGKSAMVWSGIWSAANMDEARAPTASSCLRPDFGTGPKIGGGSWQWAVSSRPAPTRRRRTGLPRSSRSTRSTSPSSRRSRAWSRRPTRPPRSRPAGPG